MFRLARDARLPEVVRRSSTQAVTYQAVGATLRAELPSGYRHDRYERALPARSDVFALAVAGLASWQAHLGAGLAVEPLDPASEGATVAVAVRLGPITAIAPCRIVGVVDEPDCYAFAYGTLPGHPEEGEEAFIVRRSDSGATFTIVAFSRPADRLARLGGPVTRLIQRSTSRRYLDALARAVETG